MSATGRMGIGLVGDSLGGVVIARALGSAGHALTGRSVPPEDRAEQVEIALPGVPVLAMEDIFRRSEMVILAAELDGLETLIQRVASQDLCQAGQIVAHLSSESGLDVLAPLQQRGVIPLRLVPLMPLTGTSIDGTRLPGQWCAVSAPTPVLPIAQALAIEIGMEPLIIEPHQEDALRDVVNRLSNFGSSLVHEAVDQLESVGVERAGAAMASLLRASLDHALRERAPEDDLLGAARALLDDAEAEND